MSIPSKIKMATTGQLFSHIKGPKNFTIYSTPLSKTKDLTIKSKYLDPSRITIEVKLSILSNLEF